MPSGSLTLTFCWSKSPKEGPVGPNFSSFQWILTCLPTTNTCECLRHPGYISKLHLHLNSLSINPRFFRWLLCQILTKQFHSDIIIQSSAVSSAA